MIGRYTTTAIPRAAKDYIETVCKYETSVIWEDRMMTLSLLQNKIVPDFIGSRVWWIVTSPVGCIGFMLTYATTDCPVIKGIDRDKLFTKVCHLDTMLQFMYVDVKHRNGGIGSRLLRLLIKKCTMADKGIYLDCLPSQTGFFNKRGFKWEKKAKRYERLLWAPNDFHVEMLKQLHSQSWSDGQVNTMFEPFYEHLQGSEANRLAFLACTDSIRSALKNYESAEKEKRAQEHRERYEAHRAVNLRLQSESVP
eukprot:2786944-Prymnesium_polylepis.1